MWDFILPVKIVHCFDSVLFFLPIGGGGEVDTYHDCSRSLEASSMLTEGFGAL